jgi:hypothetical protein
MSVGERVTSVHSDAASSDAHEFLKPIMARSAGRTDLPNKSCTYDKAQIALKIAERLPVEARRSTAHTCVSDGRQHAGTFQHDHFYR